MLTALLLTAIAATQDTPTTSLTWVPNIRLGYGKTPAPVDALKEKPTSVSRLPEGLTDPSYWLIRSGPRDAARDHVIVLDRIAPNDAKIFFDTNANGDLTDDPDVVTRKTTFADGGVSLWVTVMAYIRYGAALRAGQVDLIVNIPPGPEKQPITYFTYMPLFGYEGTITIDGMTYQCSFSPQVGAGDFRPGKPYEICALQIDRNGNRRIDSSGEAFYSNQPFNLSGTTYAIKDITADGKFEIVKSDKAVDAVPEPINLSKGMVVPDVSLKTLNGKQISLPKSFKGKVVLLDFWATWCGYCILDFPTIKKAYEDLHPKGLEILSISVDTQDKLDAAKKMIQEKGMSLLNNADGLGEAAPIVQMYGVSSYPQYVLFDGDTGKILADNDAIRPDIRRAIEQALKVKFEAAPKRK